MNLCYNTVIWNTRQHIWQVDCFFQYLEIKHHNTIQITCPLLEKTENILEKTLQFCGPNKENTEKNYFRTDADDKTACFRESKEHARKCVAVNFLHP